MSDQTKKTVAPAIGGSNTAPDLMEPAEDKPNVNLLLEELEYAWSMDKDTYGRTAWCEDVRYNRWRGQTEDGLRWRKHQGERAKPYDGAPDTRIPLADDIINYWVDVLYTAFWGARMKVAPTTARTLDASEAAELRVVMSWMINGPLRRTLIDDVEWTAQVMCTIGWVVLHPNWRTETVLRTKTITMDDINGLAAKGKSQNNVMQGLLASIPTMVLDPLQEDAAAELLRLFFPEISKAQSERMVRELRKDGKTEFEQEEDGPNTPELRVLVPGQHYVLPPEGTAMPDQSRWQPVREFFTEQALYERAAEEGWNPAFTDRAAATKGMSLDQRTVEAATDENMKLIEIFYMYQRRNSKQGVPGLFCTVLSDFVRPEAGKDVSEADYGFNKLVDFAHKQYPFIFQQTEITGLRPTDSRGIPQVVSTQQNEIKNSRDLTYIFQQLGTVPPLQKKGSSASKLPPGLAPAGIINNVNGEWSWFQPPNGKPEIAFKLIEVVRKEMEDHFGVPRADTPAAKAQLRQMRLVMRWLAKWGEALWQLAVLAYQKLSEQELEQILGRKPLLTADLVAKQQLLLWFETRAMDNDWLDSFLNRIVQLLSIDLGGTIDRSKLIALVLAYMDPTLGEEVTMDQAGAKQQVFKEVRDEINSIMQGNKPMLRQNDPTAQMKIAFANQIISGNPEFQLALNEKIGGHDNPNFNRQKAENMKTYMQNLQHNYQEMVTSKQQGKLGTKDLGAGITASGSRTGQ